MRRRLLTVTAVSASLAFAGGAAGASSTIWHRL